MDAGTMLRQALVIDLHNDTLVAHMRQRNASLCRPAFTMDAECNGLVAGPYGNLRPGPLDPLQIDLEAMHETGLDAGFFAVDVTLAHNNHLAYALDALGFLLNDLALNAPEAMIVRTVADLTRAQELDVPALILHIEHADVTEKSLNVLQALYARGRPLARTDA